MSVLLGLGWSFFLLGWVLNLAYYSLHPNMVDTDPSRRMGRLYTRPLGWCGAGRGGEERHSNQNSETEILN